MKRLLSLMSILFMLMFASTVHNDQSEEMQESLFVARAELVADIRVHFTSRYVLFITSGNLNCRHDFKGLTIVHRHMSTLSVPMAITSVEMIRLQNGPIIRNSTSRPLCVILSDIPNTNVLLREIGQRIQFSDATWLLFLDNSASLSAIFLDVIIPFNCVFLVAVGRHNDVTLTEVYHVTERLPLQQHGFGSWDASRRLAAPRDGLYARRTNLLGVKLRTASNEISPIVIVPNEVNNRTVLGVFAEALWRVLEGAMNFTSEHRVPKDRLWGSHRRNGSWGGIMGMLLRDEADVTLTAIAMTSERAEFVTYSYPVYKSRIHIFIKEPDGRPMYLSNYLSPFSPTLWTAFLVTVIVAAAILSLLYRVSRHLGITMEAFSEPEALFLIFGAVFCQQGTKYSLPNSCRIVIALVGFVGFLVMNCYSGVIMSKVMVHKPVMPFNNLDDLTKDDTFSLGMVNNSAYFATIQKAKDGKLKEIYAKFMAHATRNIPVTYHLGFQRVCEERYAFFSEETVLLYMVDRLDCRIVHLPEHFAKNIAGLAFPQDSPYIGLFNQNLLKLVNNGVLDNLYNSAVERRIPQAYVEPATISFPEVVPIIKLVANGIMLATILLAAEVLISIAIKYTHYRKQTSDKAKLKPRNRRV